MWFYPVFEITQKMDGCWVAGWPRPKISPGAGWLGGPDPKFRWVLGGPGSKFAWVLGDWVAQTENFAGCWEAGWPRTKILLGAGWLGAPTQHPGPPRAPNWVDFSKNQVFYDPNKPLWYHFGTYMGGWVHPAQKICWVLGGPDLKFRWVLGDYTIFGKSATNLGCSWKNSITVRKSAKKSATNLGCTNLDYHCNQ